MGHLPGGGRAQLIAQLCSSVPGSPPVAIERQRERDVHQPETYSVTSWEETGSAVGLALCVYFLPPTPSPGLPQFGHLLVPEYLVRVLGYHLGFPPPAVSGHQRGHASAGTGRRAPAKHPPGFGGPQVGSA